MHNFNKLRAYLMMRLHFTKFLVSVRCQTMQIIWNGMSIFFIELYHKNFIFDRVCEQLLRRIIRRKFYLFQWLKPITRRYGVTSSKDRTIRGSNKRQAVVTYGRGRPIIRSCK